MRKRRSPRSICVKTLIKYWNVMTKVELSQFMGHHRGVLYRKAKKVGLI